MLLLEDVGKKVVGPFVHYWGYVGADYFNSGNCMNVCVYFEEVFDG